MKTTVADRRRAFLGKRLRLGSLQEALMSDKVARLGIERDNDMMYYIKNGDVWATPRKQKGQPKGKAQKIAATGLEMDYSKYIYYVDGDGDVARKVRSLGGGKRAKVKPPRAAAPSRGKAGKSEAQLDREIAECLGRVKKSNGSSDATSNGAPARGRGGKKAR